MLGEETETVAAPKKSYLRERQTRNLRVLSIYCIFNMLRTDADEFLLRFVEE